MKRPKQAAAARGRAPAPDKELRLVPPEELPAEWQPPEAGSPRGRIYRAARELFAHRGLEGTSIRDITVAAGVNSAMVHYYFGSKEELYRRVLGLEILNVFQTMKQREPANLTPGELLIGLPGRIAREVRANPVWAKLFRQEMAMGALYLEKVVQELQHAGPLGVKSQFEQLYRAAIKQGELRRLPVNNVIQFLIILGYSGVFFDPFFRVMTGEEQGDSKTFEDRLKVFDSLIRHGVMTERGKTRP